MVHGAVGAAAREETSRTGEVTTISGLERSDEDPWSSAPAFLQPPTPGDSAELRPRHPTAEPPVPTAAAIDASCPAAESISTRRASPHGRKGTHDARPVEPDARAARGARLRLGRRTVRDGHVPRVVHGHRAGPRDRRLVGAAHAHGIPHRHRHRSARARPPLRSVGSAAGPALGTRGVRTLGRCDGVLPHDRRLRRAAVRPGILGRRGRRRGARHRRRPQPRCRHRPRAEPDRDRRRPRAAAGAADRRTRQPPSGAGAACSRCSQWYRSRCCWSPPW